MTPLHDTLALMLVTVPISCSLLETNALSRLHVAKMLLKTMDQGAVAGGELQFTD